MAWLTSFSSSVVSVASTVPPSCATRSMEQKCVLSSAVPMACPVSVSWPALAFTRCGSSELSVSRKLICPGFEADRRMAMRLSGAEAMYSRLKATSPRLYVVRATAESRLSSRR